MNTIKILLILALLSITNLTYSQDTSQKVRYDSGEQSVIGNGFKSLILPGWGNLERRWVYGGIEITGFAGYGIALLTGAYGGEGGPTGAYGYFIISSAVLFVNHLFAPIDAMNSTAKFNNNLKKKYNLSLSPAYNPKNNGVGIGFAVNF